jgi:hypothetical protein
MPFRIILIDKDRRRSAHVLTLEGTPQVGDLLDLHGEEILVHHVTKSSRDGLAGVVVAGRP